MVTGKDSPAESRQANAIEKLQRANKILESIQSPSLKIGSDFFSPEEMTCFKKTKRKVRYSNDFCERHFLYVISLQVRKARKTLRADDLLKDSPAGPIVPDRAKDMGSRKRKKSG